MDTLPSLLAYKDINQVSSYLVQVRRQLHANWRQSSETASWFLDT